MPTFNEEEIAFTMPEDVIPALRAIVQLCEEVLRTAGEIDIVDWAGSIRDGLETDEVKASLMSGFDQACKRVAEESESSAGNEIPVTIAQVVSEFRWLRRRIEAQPRDTRNNLGLSEIALESWKDLCDGHPAAKIAISTLKELVQVANLLRGGDSVSAGDNGKVIDRFAFLDPIGATGSSTASAPGIREMGTP